MRMIHIWSDRTWELEEGLAYPMGTESLEVFSCKTVMRLLVQIMIFQRLTLLLN